MEKIGNWVPQIFYDLIGRIVPGIMLLMIAFIIFQGPSTAQILFGSTTTTTTLASSTIETTTNISSGVLILVALVVSYVLGSLLGGIAAVVNRDFWRRKKANITGKQENDVSYVYDYIQFHRPDIGSRLAKLSAERHMCRVIQVGGGILLVIYSVAAPVAYSDVLFWMVESGLVMMGLCAFCLHRHLSSRSEELMSNNWRLIHEEKKQPARQVDC